MKVTVKVDGQTFEVEIADITARPVMAIVEGESFEVWPSANGATENQVSAVSKPASPSSVPQSPPGASSPLVSNISAPIPGVIVSVAVQPGAAVTMGQELCVLEAMKMKNIIRSPRAGTIATVKITVGQTVKHRDILVEYGE